MLRVYDDDEEWFRSIFGNSEKEKAIQNQYEFLVQRMGGPPLYSQRRGQFCSLVSSSNMIDMYFQTVYNFSTSPSFVEFWCFFFHIKEIVSIFFY